MKLTKRRKNNSLIRADNALLMFVYHLFEKAKTSMGRRINNFAFAYCKRFMVGNDVAEVAFDEAKAYLEDNQRSI